MAARRGARRWALVALGVFAVLLTATGPVWATRVARQISWFEIQRVEISGAFLLAPHEVLEASGVHVGQHLLEELAVWESALRAHPVIADARVSRHLPHTLRVRIREERPVAFVGDSGLTPATGAGQLLPVDPARAPVDLPIMRGNVADSTEAAAMRRMLAEVGRLTGIDPVLMAGVSEIQTAAPIPDALILRHSSAHLIVPLGVDPQRVAQLRATLHDVERRQAGPAGDGHTAELPVLDARFGDQIVVRPSSPGKRS
jgi:cell division protein FtsQ